MATLSSIARIPARNSLNSNRIPKIIPNYLNLYPYLRSIRSFRVPISPLTKAASTSSTTTRAESDEEEYQELMSIEALKRFMDLNLGNWTGSFHQFDSEGNLLHKVDTKLSTSTYGEDELISLLQTLYIKQATSSTSVSGDEHEEEWAEYKIKETNMFTVEKYQQSADLLLPQREGLCIKVSDSWHAGECIKARGAR